jgi:hypothetical protein
MASRSGICATLSSLLLVMACAPVATVAPPPPPPPAPVVTLGMERVLGASPEAVIAILGRPSLDREEGPARHLQFAHGNVCTLDLFFYPRPPAGGRVATHAEARRRDGSPLDPASCLESQFLSRPVG